MDGWLAVVGRVCVCESVVCLSVCLLAAPRARVGISSVVCLVLPWRRLVVAHDDSSGGRCSAAGTAPLQRPTVVPVRAPTPPKYTLFSTHRYIIDKYLLPVWSSREQPSCGGVASGGPAHNGRLCWRFTHPGRIVWEPGRCLAFRGLGNTIWKSKLS